MVDAISPQALSELIGSIYDCVLDPDLWNETLEALRATLDGQMAVLHLNDLRQGRVLSQKTVGIDPYWLAQQAKYIPELHAMLPPRPTLDEPYVLSRDVDPAIIGASPFVREWMQPQGLSDLMQLFLVHTPERFSGVALSWHGRHGVVTDFDYEGARQLLPHLRRAVTISNVLDVRTIECARMADTLDALRCGVVLTDGRATILHANNAAQHMLLNGSPIQGVGGILSTKTPAAARELHNAIKLAAQDECRIGKTGLAIRLNFPDPPPVVAHVLPLTGSEIRTRLRPEAVAAIFIAVPEEQDAVPTIAAVFGLTPAETQVVASLLAGRTRAETATHLGITLATTKTHLASIFAKTGVSRQAELIQLGARFVPPTSST